MSTGVKDLSKWGVVIGTVLVVALSILKAFWGLFSSASFGLSMTEIVMVGGFCVVAWSPVYVSLWIDKFTGKKEAPCGAEPT